MTTKHALGYYRRSPGQMETFYAAVDWSVPESWKAKMIKDGWRWRNIQQDKTKRKIWRLVAKGAESDPHIGRYINLKGIKISKERK